MARRLLLLTGVRSFFFTLILVAGCGFHPCFGGEATVPFSFKRDLLWVEVAVPGRAEPLQFIFDTGAGRSVLDLGVARDLGLAEGPAEVVKVVGTTKAAFPVEGFQGLLGGIPMPDTMLAMDLRPWGRMLFRRIDGLVGADFLKGVVTRIDYARERLVFLGSGDAVAVPTGAEVVPLKFVTDGICVPVSVDGGEPGWVRLDTGCRDALHWTASRQGGRAGDEPASIGLAGGGAGQRVVQVRLGPVDLGRTRGVFHPREIFTREAGLLGNTLLLGYEVTIDPFRRRLVLDSGRTDGG